VGLAGAGRTDEEDVRLGELDVSVLPELLQAHVVVVHRHGHRALRVVLVDHVSRQVVEDLAGARDRGRAADPAVARALLRDDAARELDAFVAHVDAWSRHHDLDLVVALRAERTQDLGFGLVRHCALFLARLGSGRA
jgi:ABC-type thiamine transport system ATPase subunit